LEHNHSNTGENNDSKSLNLLQRVNIAIDVANALDYLHNQLETGLVHCDLKPSNILLDGDLVAHVADFGLAKFFPTEVTVASSSNQESSSIGIKGTIGYAAPGRLFSFIYLVNHLETFKRESILIKHKDF